jgi:hypothetical protein
VSCPRVLSLPACGERAGERGSHPLQILGMKNFVPYPSSAIYADLSCAGRFLGYIGSANGGQYGRSVIAIARAVPPSHSPPWQSRSRDGGSKQTKNISRKHTSMTTNPGQSRSPPSTAAATQSGIAGSPRPGQGGRRAVHLAPGASSVFPIKRMADRSGGAPQVLQEIHPRRADDYAHFGLND